MEPSKNVNPYTLQENGLSSECGQINFFKFDQYENDDPHVSKEKHCSQVYLQMFIQISKARKKQ